MSEIFYPEENLARIWIERLELEHPISIEHVVSEFADVEYDNFPFHADAVLISSDRAGERARIFLNRNLPETRKTFTLAHELGHILIPWHTGKFVCTPMDSFNFPYQEALHQHIEREANRFAAEFLMPSDFISNTLGNPPNLIKTVELLSNNGISQIAISYRLLKFLPPGFLMIEVDNFNRVVSSGRSTTTFLQAPERGENLELERFKSIGATIHTFKASSLRKIYWVDLQKVSTSRPSTEDEPDSKEILADLLVDLKLEHCRASVNGIIGSANSLHKGSQMSDLYTILVERFQNRDQIQKLVDHPRFLIFLAKKAEEIEGRG